MILFVFVCLNPLTYGKGEIGSLNNGELGKLFKVHSSLFDTFMPLEKVGRTEKMRLLVNKNKMILWEKFSKNEQLALALRVFGDLKLFTSKTIIKIIYKVVTKEEDQIKKVDDESIKKLKVFLKSVRTKKIRPSIYHLTRQERLRFFELMIRSEINFHRYLAFSIRNAYMNYVYQGEIVNEITGIKDDTDKTANPLPKIPEFKSSLSFDQKRRKFKGELDYIIVGSGVAGSVVANQLQKAGKKVLVLEKGPFVLPGSIKTYLNWKFLINQMPEPDNDGSVVFLNASMVGGATSLNNGFSFPPTLPYIKNTINGWRKKWSDSGRPYYNIWSPEEMERAYSWLENKFRPRVVQDDEINNNNLLLMKGFFAHTGMKAKKFELFRFKKGEGPTEVYDMKSAVETLLFESLFDEKNPLTLVPDAKVTKVIIKGRKKKRRAIGVEFMMVPPRNRPGVLIDPYGFKIPQKKRVRVYAKNVIISAGNIGSTMILKESSIKNENIGKGFTTHPYVPVMGEFEEDINSNDGELASVYVDHYLKKDLPTDKRGFLLETASSSADIAGVLEPSLPAKSLSNIVKAKKFGGMGVLLIDSVNLKNRIETNGDIPRVFYNLSAKDKKRMAYGVSEAAKILLKAGAKRVTVLTFENILGKRSWKQGLSIKTLEEADLFRTNLKLIPNRTLLMAAHMLGANKLGVDPKTSVVNPHHQVWGVKHLYVVDSSVFPSSPGANPMTTIYSIAKLFTERHLTIKARN